MNDSKKRWFLGIITIAILAFALFFINFGLQRPSSTVPDANAQGVPSYYYPGGATTPNYAGLSAFPGDWFETSFTCSSICTETYSTCAWNCGATFEYCDSSDNNRGSHGGSYGGGISLYNLPTKLTCPGTSFGCFGGGTYSTCGGGFLCGGTTRSTCSSFCIIVGGSNTIITCGGGLSGCGVSTLYTCAGASCGGFTRINCPSPEPRTFLDCPIEFPENTYYICYLSGNNYYNLFNSYRTPSSTVAF